MMDMSETSIEIDGRRIGDGHPTYVIAEVSANHNQSIEEARELVRIAARCGADAVKLQTYTPDTMTIDCDKDCFMVGKGTIWEGRRLYELYGEAQTPWEWLPELQQTAREEEITLFSTPFDSSSVEFLERHKVPAYKIASFEMTDHPLLEAVATTGKPVILSTGMGTLREIAEAVEVLRGAGCEQIALLKCTSAYPAAPEEANLAQIPHMKQSFRVPVGLSDHTMGSTVSTLAVSLGASIVEKHFTQSRSVPGPDSAFSLEPSELEELVQAVRVAEKAVGRVAYTRSEKEESSLVFRRSLFAVEAIEAGSLFTDTNVRVIRPGFGLEPKHLKNVIGRWAACRIERGTPLSWDLID